MADSLTEEELRELERWADEFDEAARDPECGEHPEVRRRMRRICLLSRKATRAVRNVEALLKTLREQHGSMVATSAHALGVINAVKHVEAALTATAEPTDGEER